MFQFLSSTSMDIILRVLYALMMVLTACGAFLVGVNLMSKGFIHLASKENSLFVRGFQSSNRFGGVFAGFLHSAFTQSSDNTTVSLVRLADLGLITLAQACAAIIGANIGTTCTTFIVSLSSFNLTPYFAFAAFIGALPLLSNKTGPKVFGEIVAGFGVVFIGIYLLETNLQDEYFRNFANNVFNLTTSASLLVFIGFLMTAVVQSSSVITSMVVFFVSSSILPLRSALFLVMGANVGTCVTCWFAALGSTRNARRTALFHMTYNIIGVVLMLLIYSIFKDDMVNFVDSWPVSIEFKVALFHLGFNLITAVVVIPLLRPLTWLCKKIVKF